MKKITIILFLFSLLLVNYNCSIENAMQENLNLSKKDYCGTVVTVVPDYPIVRIYTTQACFTVKGKMEIQPGMKTYVTLTSQRICGTMYYVWIPYLTFDNIHYYEIIGGYKHVYR